MSKFIEYIEDIDQIHRLAPVATAPIQRQIFVCNGKSCSAVGSAEVKKAFAEQLDAKKLRYGKESKGRNPNGTVVLTDCSSVGFCAIGAAVLVYPEGIWYGQVRESDVEEIIEKHIENGEIVKRLAIVDMQNHEKLD
jgi:(2Fe-2S) ferredoxin